MMMKTTTILFAVGLVTGCANTDVFTGTPECAYIGCAQGGVTVYNHEPWGATEQPRRWYGWEWGTSSSAYAPGTPEYRAARAQECARARSHGLDCQGRPLYKE